MHRRQFSLPTQPRQCWLRRRLTHFSVCRDRLHSFHPQTISIHDEQAITFSQTPTEIDFPESRFATSGPSTDGISCPLIHTKTIGEKFDDRSPGMIEIESFEIFGHPNENVKDSLSPLREKFNHFIGGFSRWSSGTCRVRFTGRHSAVRHRIYRFSCHGAVILQRH